jgi:hypothetical protein
MRLVYEAIYASPGNQVLEKMINGNGSVKNRKDIFRAFPAPLRPRGKTFRV